MKQILALSRARKSYDGKVVLDDVTLGLLPGAKIGLVGPNGTGKSTLLKMLTGLEQHLARYPGTVAAVTHDTYFLDNAAGWILELDRGHAYRYEGNYSPTWRPSPPGWARR